MTLTSANIVSLIRILIAPVFYVLLVSDKPEYIVVACILFIIGAITDYLDGWLARKFHQVTAWGKFFDPLADKFLTTAAFFAFARLEIIPVWMLVVIVIRDFGTTGLRIFADLTGRNIKTSYSAKIKTFLQMLFIAYIMSLLFLKASGLFGIQLVFIDSLIYSEGTLFTMALLTLITVWTFIEYLINNFPTANNAFVSLFGIGFLPKAPGTYGSAAAMAVLLIPDNFRIQSLIVLIFFSFFLSIPAIKRAEAVSGQDPSYVVIDEAIAMWMILSIPFVSASLFWAVAGFVLFRIFDIFKPYPINLLNKRKGAIYVLGDDIAAAVLTAVCLYIFYWASHILPFAFNFL